MLLDNFPFRAYGNISEDVIEHHKSTISQQDLAALNRVAESYALSLKAIFNAILSIYLYKYMDDNFITTALMHQDNPQLITLTVENNSDIKSLAVQCERQLEQGSLPSFSEDYIAFEVSDNTQPAKQMPSACLLLLSTNQPSPFVQLSYKKGFLSQGAEQLITHQIVELLKQLPKHFEQSIDRLSLVSNKIRDNILNDFRIEHKTFDYEYGIYQRFADQVSARPDHIALEYKDQRFSYSALSQRVDELAAKLYYLGAREGSRIAVFLHRSDWSIVSLLAITKLGASYIPLESSYPSDYIQHIQLETQFSFMISEHDLLSQIEGINCQSLDIHKINQYIASPEPLPVVAPLAHHEFAILYTSGTTGKPKGAIYNHASPLNKFSWMWDFFKFQEDDVFLQRTSVNFSPSLWEIFGALLIGRRTVLVPDEVVKDPVALINTISDKKVTFMGVVPALLRLLTDASSQAPEKLKTLRYISCSGEPMQIDLYNKVKSIAPHLRLFNDYGSTEMNAVGYSEISEQSTQSKNFPIGKPISNVYYYVLDKNLNLVPPYMTGNLYVGGVSLLNGYVNGVEPPFVHDPILNTGIAYFKSGDKARFLSNGQIELVGRDDFIVKVRGMRVSLYQVETVIKEHQAVKDACVVSRRKTNGDNEILVYLDTEESALAIRSYCLSLLPEYMVPSKFISYGVLPKKTNGKLDRKKLADLAASQQEERYTPSNPDDIKQSLLELIQVSFGEAVDDFDCPFSMLGMTSIDAVEMTAEINRLWSLNMNVGVIAQYNTLNRLYAYVNSLVNGGQAPEIEEDNLEAEVEQHSLTTPVTQVFDKKIAEQILITGANGFLGSCVVSSLIRNTNATIHCLIRAASYDQAVSKLSKRLFQSGVDYQSIKDRITVICADITRKRLGLSEEDYDALSHTIDGVFHLAADTNHFSDYGALKKANVIATENMIDFCCHKKSKSLLFSSSISVLLKQHQGHYYIEKDEALVSSKHLYNGYGKTKWVSEQILHKAHEQGLKVAIVRLGELSFHSETGAYREDDIFHSCLKLFSEIPCTPQWANGYIDCLAVDKTADALSHIFAYIHTSTSTSDEQYIFNLTAKSPIAIDQVVASDQPVQLEEWLGACLNHIAENNEHYPPAFGAFFDRGENALITEYFKKIDIDMHAYDALKQQPALENLSVSQAKLQAFCQPDTEYSKH